MLWGLIEENAPSAAEGAATSLSKTQTGSVFSDREESIMKESK
jgi:hypothetical protein